MNSPPGGIVTFLFTDIEGSTRLWEQHAEAMQPILARHDAILRSTVLAHGGYVVKMRGDGIHAAFSSAPAALNATLAIQRALQDADWGGIGTLKVRAALHTANVEWRDGDYYGAPVNRAARLLTAGHGGQMLLSQATREHLGDDLPPDVSLRDLGLHRLKDLVQPERVFQVVAPDLPAEFRPLITLSTLPNVLPTQLTPFIGRDKEVAEGAALLRRRDVRLLTLTGPGGTGKTRLGLQIVADVLDGFSDGLYFVDLSVVRDPALVPLAIARVLNIPDIGGVDTMTSLTSYLREKQLLLVLDNCEQVVAAAPVVSQLLTAADGLKVLATSRVRLRLVMEHTYAVPALTLPDVRRLPPLPICTQCEAVKLFVERSLAVKPAFAVTDASAPAVAQICVRLDGLPLAIELAAAHSRQMAPQALLKHLEQGMGLLAGGPRDLPTRQQTMKATIGWSYALLTDEEQGVLRQLGVFVGGWTAEAAAAVCGREVDEDLRSLAEQSLIRQHEEADGTQRFTMLETVRSYALERLEKGGEGEETRERHANYFVVFSEEAERHFFRRGQEEWWDKVQTDMDNLRAVFRWSAEHDRAEQGLRILSATSYPAINRAWHLEWLGWFDKLLSLPSGQARSLVRARALNRAGRFALGGEGQLERSERLDSEGAELALSLGEVAEAAYGYLGQSHTLQHTDPERAKVVLARAKELARLASCPELDNGLAVIDLWVASWGPQKESIGPLLQPALDYCLRVGDRSNEALVREMWGAYASLVQKNFEEAHRQYDEGFAILDSMGGNLWSAKDTWLMVNHTYMGEGNFAKAEEVCLEALRVARSYGDSVHSAGLLQTAGRAAMLQGKDAVARQRFEESLALLGNRDSWWIVLNNLHCLALLAQRAGDEATCARHMCARLRIVRDHWLGPLNALGAMFNVFDALSARDPCRTAMVLGAAQALTVKVGAPVPQPFAEKVQETTATVRQALGDVEYASAYQKGLMMTRTEALDCALAALER